VRRELANLEETFKLDRLFLPQEPGLRGCSPKQFSLAEKFHGRKYRMIAAVGGNRAGKSILAGGMCLSLFLRDVATNGTTAWVIAPTFKKSVENVQSWLWNWLPHASFVSPYKPENGFHHSSSVRLRTRDGGFAKIIFKTEEEDLNSFESSDVDVVWWDEASQEAIFGRLLPRVADRAGRILISAVPNVAWLGYRIMRSKTEGWIHETFSSYDNEANLPEGEIERMSAGMTPEERRMRIKGQYVVLSGVIIPEFIDEQAPVGHLIETFPIPSQWPRFLYLDVGYYTACLLIAVAPNGRYYVVDEVYTEGRNVAENTVLIKEMAEREGMTLLSGRCYCDPSAYAYTAASTATIAEQYEERGLPLEGWTRTHAVRDTTTLTAGEKAMINRMRMWFINDRVRIFSRCLCLRRELGMWRWKLDAQQKVDIREVEDTGPNHAIDGLKAAIWAEHTFDEPERYSVSHTREPVRDSWEL